MKMRRVYQLPLLLLALSGIPRAAQAETIELVCVDNTNYSANFSIDTEKGSVIHLGIKARNVRIDPGAFFFTVDLNGVAYFHAINRSTGQLEVSLENGQRAVSLQCQRAKPKF